jgi:hypothetical protein
MSNTMLKHSTKVCPPIFATANTSSTRVGWTAGGGLQYAVVNNWWVFAEYRFSDFGTLRDNLLAVQLPVVRFSMATAACSKTRCKSDSAIDSISFLRRLSLPNTDFRTQRMMATRPQAKNGPGFFAARPLLPICHAARSSPCLTLALCPM